MDATSSTVKEISAVALFNQSAKMHDHKFTISDDNLPAI
jgi:hypothetical protein